MFICEKEISTQQLSEIAGKGFGDMVKGVVDVEKELERIAKELEKARKNLSSLEGKLSNENFVSRAPEHVVADIREKAQKARDLIAGLEQSEEAMKKL